MSSAEEALILAQQYALEAQQTTINQLLHDKESLIEIHRSLKDATTRFNINECDLCQRWFDIDDLCFCAACGCEWCSQCDLEVVAKLVRTLDCDHAPQEACTDSHPTGCLKCAIDQNKHRFPF